MSTAANIQAVRLAITSDFLPGWVTRLLRPGKACRLPSIVKGDTPCGPFVILKSLITLEICDGRVLAQSRAGRNDCDGRQDVRTAVLGWLAVALLLLGFSVGRAFDRDEASLTVQVSSADHEQEE